MSTRIGRPAAAYCCIGVLVTVIVPFASARADVVISSAPTQNITCAAGVCAPTAANAVLNITDLENLLASGSLTVTTTGSSVQADNVDVKAPLTWSNPNALAFA